MKLVVIESPYRGEGSAVAWLPLEQRLAVTIAYARACLLDVLRRGEAPYASHLLYTQVLPDVAEDRQLGTEAGAGWMAKADLVASYIDLGWTQGMHDGNARAMKLGIATDIRKLKIQVGDLQPQLGWAAPFFPPPPPATP